MLDYDLAEAIVNKYHRGAKRAGLVWTSYDYAVKKGLYPEEADDYGLCP